MSLADLEKAVSVLPPDELTQFSTWFEDYLAERWEARFEADIESGKLDQLAGKADLDFDAGRCTEL